MTDPYPENSETNDPLIGSELCHGWVITSRLSRHAKQTGGAFSNGYIATKENDQAYVKAFDFEAVFKDEDPMKALEKAVKTYNFERELLSVCESSNLKRIVRAIGNGVLDNASVPFGKLYYLLFELADADARIHVVANGQANIAWSMRALHHIASALKQLHGRGIFHQDLKPSNVLIFRQEGASKLGDLGRAHRSGMEAPHDGATVPGAWRYAAPELLYRAGMDDKIAQRAASELYLFGSMIYFFVTHLPLTPDIMQAVRPQHRVALFGGRNLGLLFMDVLPFLTDAHADLMRSFEARLLALVDGDKKIAAEVTTLLRYATVPDPKLRGHPSARRMASGNPYDLERFVSGFNLVASVLERQKPPAHA
ncbi:protein kinase [Bradyrhizobium sp. RT3a]|uniref:protein kinase domain-containing protein n=1 Tax=Bradyrhizobium sp. RT3a TaxID=3156333 RepID=UPI0033985FC1